jgi:hypothetical protein
MRKMIATTVIAFYLFSILQAIPAVAQQNLTITHQPIEEASVNEPILLRAVLEGQVSGKIVYIMYRKTGHKDFHSVSMASAADNAYQGEIPAKMVTADGVDYYLRVLDPIGSQLARFPEDDGFISVTTVAPEPAAPEPSVPEVPPTVPPPPTSLPVSVGEEETPPTEEVEEIAPPVPDKPLRILHTSVAEGTADQPLELVAELTVDTPGGTVYIMYRKTGQKDFRSQMMAALGDLAFSGEIPGKSVTSAGLEYFLQVVDPIGNQLARYPEAESLVSILVPVLELIEEAQPVEEVPPVAEERPQIIPETTKKGGLQTWHWVGLGALAAAGLAAIALSGGDGDGDGNGGPTLEKLPDPPDRP